LDLANSQIAELVTEKQAEKDVSGQEIQKLSAQAEKLQEDLQGAIEDRNAAIIEAEAATKKLNFVENLESNFQQEVDNEVGKEVENKLNESLAKQRTQLKLQHNRQMEGLRASIAAQKQPKKQSSDAKLLQKMESMKSANVALVRKNRELNDDSRNLESEIRRLKDKITHLEMSWGSSENATKEVTQRRNALLIEIKDRLRPKVNALEQAGREWKKKQSELESQIKSLEAAPDQWKKKLF